MKISATKKVMFAALVAIAASAPIAAFAAPPKSHAAKTHKTSTQSTAHEETTSGTVDAYAAGTRTLKLSTGNEFKLAPSITQTSFKNGDKVTVSWKMQNGSRVADKVEIK